MGELEFARKLNMSDSVTSAVAADERHFGLEERERAEGESADDSEPSDGVDEANDDSEDEDEEEKGTNTTLQYLHKVLKYSIVLL